MLPQVLRPANFNTPIAELLIDGLGICCFNRTSGEWQIAFLRKEHDLTIAVRKIDPEGRIQPILDPFDVSTEAKHLRLSVQNPSTAHTGQFGKGVFTTAEVFPTQQRRTRDDDYDFRWVIDVAAEADVPHQFERLRRESERDPTDKVTIISIPHALFYTKRVTQDSVILARQGQTHQQGFVFGRTNEVVGAGLYATTQTSQVRLVDVPSQTPVQNFPLPVAAAGHMYEISIMNMDRRPGGKLDEPRQLIDGYVRGDLHLYYTIMHVGGVQHQLFAPPRRSIVNRAIDGDCHIVGGGHNGENLTSLMDLIQP